MLGNELKAEAYRHLKVKLKKALSSSFWFEAIMIEYALFEDRTSSILDHCKICENAFDTNKQLSKKLNSIQHQIGKGHAVISKVVSRELIDNIRTWKDERNEVVHRACNRVYDEGEVRELAIKGKELVRQIDNSARRVRNATNKK